MIESLASTHKQMNFLGMISSIIVL